MPLPIEAMGLALLFGMQQPAAPPPAAGPQGSSEVRPGEEHYDVVGFATADAAAADSVHAAHATLPIGSFVEVTALDSGRTVLMEITARTAPDERRIIALSPAAARLLGTAGNARAGVRVRKVDPPRIDQIALRAGEPASPRMDSPPVLLAALRKRLPVDAPPAPLPTKLAPPKPAPPKPAPPKPAPPATSTGYFVQLAAVSSLDRATALAKSVGGAVSPMGKLYRVRIGPFADRAKAGIARDGAVKRGYGDASIILDR